MKRFLLTLLFSLSLFGQGTTPTFQVDTLNDLVQVPIQGPATKMTAIVKGRLSANDGGGDTYVYQSASSTTTNAGSIVKPASTTGRWLSPDKGKVNAKKYGATGNGSTDDVTALNNAVAAIKALGGGELYLPKGTYAVSNHFVVDFDNFTLSGDGMGVSIIKVLAWVDGFAVRNPNYPAFPTNVIHNITVHDLTVNGNRSGWSPSPDDTYGNGLNFNGVDNGTVYNVEVLNSSQQGICQTYYNVSNVTQTAFSVKNCRVVNPGVLNIGIGMEGIADNFVVDGNYISGTNVTGIFYSTEESPTVGGRIINNVVEQASGQTNGVGIYLLESVQNTIVSDNFIYGASVGIRASTLAHTVAGLKLDNNIVSNFFAQGILLTPIDSGVSPNSSISGNILINPVLRSGVYGIDVISGAKITGNILYGDYIGIRLQGTNNNVTGNWANNMTAVNVVSTLGKNQIFANTFNNGVSTSNADFVDSVQSAKRNMFGPVRFNDNTSFLSGSGTNVDLSLLQNGVVTWDIINTATTGNLTILNGSGNGISVSNSAGDLLTTGDFTVSGTKTRFNGAQYTWPGAVGAASTYLTDAAGNGTLSWATIGGTISGLTAQYIPIATAATTLGNSHLLGSATYLIPDGDATIALGSTTNQFAGGFFQALNASSNILSLYNSAGTIIDVFGPAGGLAIGSQVPPGAGNLTTSGTADFSGASTALSYSALNYYGGGTSSSFPRWKRNSAAWDARLGDDSGYATINGANVNASSSLQIGGVNAFDISANVIRLGTGGTLTGVLLGPTAVTMNGTFTSYNSIATAGNGIPAIRANARSTAQTAAVASVATYTLPATDASFEVSGNVLVTTSSAEAFAVQVDYTDEGNTARTLTLPFTGLAGTSITQINFANGAVPYEGIRLQIRCKASTSITVKTTGTFTGCTYNVEGHITRI